MPTITYIGCYGPGITVCERDGARLTPVNRIATPDPSWLAIDHRGEVLYAVDELTEPSVAAFAIDGADLRLLNRRPTEGEAPCHLLVHHHGFLLSANYGGGSVSVFPVLPDGSLGPVAHQARHAGSGPDAERQTGPHAHEVLLAGPLVVVVDLGLDRLVGYRLDPASGELTVSADPFARTQPGAGPGPGVAPPNGRWYVANELDSTVAVFDPDATTGVLRQVAAVPATPSTVDGRNYPASIVLSADANRLYVSNRGRDSIVTFEVNAYGDLEIIDEVSCGGSWPRHFTIVDDVMLVANERSTSVVSFALDPATGLPRPTGDVLSVGAPTCVLAT